MAGTASPTRSLEELDKKLDIEHEEVVDLETQAPPTQTPGAGSSGSSGKDAALTILGDSAQSVIVTAEQDRAVLRKIDLWLMPVIFIVYFLQQLDKSSLSYASVFGIQTDANLHGKQYSWLGSIVYVAQLVWQPVSSYLIVRMPVAKYLFVNVFMWGAVVACSAAAHDFKGLITARFFLGIFEATVAPCFITITQMWWRRREQTMRLGIWYAANAATGMVGSLLAWGIGHIKSDKLFPWQTIFLFIGLLTVVLSPLVWIILPDSPPKARFLNREEKIVAVERLRANNMGMEAKVWKWEQVWDLVLDPKTYLWFAMLFLCALPSGGIGTFGPLIIKGFGFNQFETLLFNIPFAALQFVLTIIASWVATRIKLKSPVVFFLTLPPSLVQLLCSHSDEVLNSLSFFTAIQPMLYTWSSQNTAGHTKKLCTTATVFVSQCVGNIVGPLLYTSEEAPEYRRGLIASLVCWVGLAATILITAAYLSFLNRKHAKARHRAGKAADIVDTSLESAKDAERLQQLNRDKEREEGADPTVLNAKAFDDLTDTKNEDFIYVL
ncbi:major facilitator superfamily domain-containing protein [Irpex lacteus]|nr:major facilitator superfamily domain-containing protein [Irpex lacteus]